MAKRYSYYKMQEEFIEAVDSASNHQNLFNQIHIPSAFLKVSVIVPARNEAENICKTLDALRLQTDDHFKPLNPQHYEVLLLVNNSTDQTFSIAKNYQQKYPEFPLHIAEVFLPPTKANIGFVRRLLMDEAYKRLTSVGKFNGIIASTDGDTEVDCCWVYHIIKEIENGCDAVGGRILTYADKSCARLFHLRDVTYRNLLAKAETLIDPEAHDPWPRHFQYFGASMAVTCAIYQQVGRLPQVPYLEDDAFHKALIRMDARVRKTPAVKAYTSTRITGRVEVGFSEQLRKWSGYEKNGLKQEVEPVDAWITKFISRKMLRRCRETYLSDGFYNRDELQKVSENLFIDLQWLHQQLTSTQYFGELWENIRKKLDSANWQQKWKLVDITDAINNLRQFVKQH